jgi:hypothetical protein
MFPPNLAPSSNCSIDETCIHQPTVIRETQFTLDTLGESIRDEILLLLTEKRNGNGPQHGVFLKVIREIKKTPVDQPQRLINPRTSHGDAKSTRYMVLFVMLVKISSLKPRPLDVMVPGAD